MHTDDFYPKKRSSWAATLTIRRASCSIYIPHTHINVYTIEWNDKSPDGLPVTVYTHDDMQQIAEQRISNTSDQSIYTP